MLRWIFQSTNGTSTILFTGASIESIQKEIDAIFPMLAPVNKNAAQ